MDGDAGGHGDRGQRQDVAGEASSRCPSVAELPTCQNTLHSCAPLISVTVLPDAVISVESVWKMKTESGRRRRRAPAGRVRSKAPLLGPE